MLGVLLQCHERDLWQKHHTLPLAKCYLTLLRAEQRIEEVGIVQARKYSSAKMKPFTDTAAFTDLFIPALSWTSLVPPPPKQPVGVVEVSSNSEFSLQ